MDSCCQDKACELTALREHQSRVLWIVLAINGAMFSFEVIIGLVAGSTALLADALDMLGDALVYGFSLYVINRSTRWQAGASLLKGTIMGVFGLMALGQAVATSISPDVPDFRLMAITGVLALLANGSCLFLLTGHRHDNLNMRSTWLCSRNDIIANVGVLLAAAGVFALESMWPDLVIGMLIMVVFLRSAFHVLKQAITESQQETKGRLSNQAAVMLDTSKLKR